MNIIALIKYGFAKTWQCRYLVLLLYIFQLLLAITIGLQVYQVIEASIGNSLNLDKLVSGFDYTVIQDLINIHGASISPLIGQMRWFILSYLVYSTFLQGGVLYTVVKDDYHWLNFWRGGALCFVRFLAFGAFFIILFLFWTVLIWMPYLSAFFSLMENWTTERPIIWLLIALIVIYFLGLAFLFSWALFTRLDYIHHKSSFFISIRRGFGYIITNFRVLTALCLFYALVIFGLYYLNIFLELTIGIHTNWLIIIFFVLQQSIIWVKIGIRVSIYSSFSHILKQGLT